MGDAAVAAAKAIGYVGAGTVEFIAEQDGRFYFMEMNTRLQVEHPVTEMITGLDLVEWQLRVAAGEPLPLAPGRDRDSRPCDRGAAVRRGSGARLPAVDRPHRALAHARSRTRACASIPAFAPATRSRRIYDPMLGKLIVWGEDRDRACAGLLDALRDCEVAGVATNIAFLERVVAHPAFATAQLDTGLIDKHRDALFPPPATTPRRALVAAARRRVPCDGAGAVASRRRVPAIRTRHGTRRMAGGRTASRSGRRCAFADGDVAARRPGRAAGGRDAAHPARVDRARRARRAVTASAC